MTITLNLKPEVEARLMAQATLYGVSMEAYLESLIQAHLADQQEKPFYETATDQEWEAGLRSWVNSHDVTKPPLSDEAISRESIYREREDSQL